MVQTSRQPRHTEPKFNGSLPRLTSSSVMLVWENFTLAETPLWVLHSLNRWDKIELLVRTSVVICVTHVWLWNAWHDLSNSNVWIEYNGLQLTEKFVRTLIVKTDHVIQSDDDYQTISAVRFDIRCLILFRWQKNQETGERSSKLHFSANCSFFARSFRRGGYPPIYQPPKGVYLLNIQLYSAVQLLLAHMRFNWRGANIVFTRYCGC